MLKERCDMLILGQGPAGLSAGIYAKRSGFDVMVLDRGAAGGQVMTTEHIENYPGFPGGIAGAELAQRMEEHAKGLGVPLEYGEVKSLTTVDGGVLVATDSGDTTARAVIIATGAVPRPLGIPGEQDFWGRGVSYCAVCDGNFFRGRPVCVIGGGDAAVEEASYLARICETVYVVHRRGELRAKKSAQEALLRLPNVKMLWHHVAVEVLGSEAGVEKLRVRDVRDNSEREVDCDGVFFYVGIRPNLDFAGPELRRTDAGFLWTDAHLMTSMPGVFGAGDVRREINRQIVTAVADGAEAALFAERYLTEQKA